MIIKTLKNNIKAALALAALALPAAAQAQQLQIFCSGPGGLSTGNCTLDDIVRTAASFGNMLMEISGALFFATFVYGGARYLLSFGRSDWVQKGTQAMKGGATGMLIVILAWTIVRYVAFIMMGKNP